MYPATSNDSSTVLTMIQFIIGRQMSCAVHCSAGDERSLFKAVAVWQRSKNYVAVYVIVWPLLCPEAAKGVPERHKKMWCAGLAWQVG